MNDTRQAVLQYLPKRLRNAVCACAAMYDGAYQEIRMTRNKKLTLSMGRNMIDTKAGCTDAEFEEVLMALCDNSLYSHSETIRSGYIITKEGIRAGVCGRAVITDGSCQLVTDLSSVCIRIPHRVPGLSDHILDCMIGSSSPCGMLIYSSPGVGKTTVLRELTAALAAFVPMQRCAVVDTRYEITAGIDTGHIDVLKGYPRSIGMECAVRTLAPQIVICDEIDGEEDRAAILNCASSGVAVVATAHAKNESDLKTRPILNDLLSKNIFPYVTQLIRAADTVEQKIIKWGEKDKCFNGLAPVF